LCLHDKFSGLRLHTKRPVPVCGAQTFLVHNGLLHALSQNSHFQIEQSFMTHSFLSMATEAQTARPVRSIRSAWCGPAGSPTRRCCLTQCRAETRSRTPSSSRDTPRRLTSMALFALLRVRRHCASRGQLYGLTRRGLVDDDDRLLRPNKSLRRGH
jgi:hypothetical protein